MQQSRLARVAAPLIVSILLALATPSPSLAASPGPDVRVMSFNIRFGTANDGENHWEKRKEFLVETIRNFDPVLLGTQETLVFQRDYLAEKLVGREAFGVGRDDGSEKGEMAAILYRKDRFERLDGGNFWLSETPDQPGSKSWDSSLPRIVTWLKLHDRENPTSPPFVYFNAHFDHRGKEARLQSARLILTRVMSLPRGTPVIVTGDFNCDHGSEPYRALFGVEKGILPRLHDAFASANRSRTASSGTFSGFDAKRTNGPRIDWIGCSSEWEVTSCDIDRTERNGRTPSDHFPVKAVVRLKAAK